MERRCASPAARLSGLCARRRARRGTRMQGLVTVFGGSGFVGAQIVRALARRDHRVRVAVRRPGRGYRLPMLGDVGQIEIVQANIRDAASVGRALDGAEACVNAVAVLYQSGRQTFEDLHVAGARASPRRPRRGASNGSCRSPPWEPTRRAAPPTPAPRPPARRRCARRHPLGGHRPALGGVRARTTTSSTASPPWPRSRPPCR